MVAPAWARHRDRWQAYDSLKAYLGGRGQALDAGSLRLRVNEVTAIGDWEHNWKGPVAA